jgi:hypothetical protein
VAANQDLRNQLTREYFPSIVDLRDQIHISAWSDHHLITKPLFDLLPFGRILTPTAFYGYVDYRLGEVAEEANRNLLYWSLSGAQHFDQTPASQISLFFDETFFWHYYVPEKKEEILESLHNGNRIRFLSRFHISQTQAEVEFNEIRLITTGPEPQFVYTDSKEYTYQWGSSRWDVHISNSELTVINPRTYTNPPTLRAEFGRETAYRQQLQRILSDPENPPSDAQYWGSVDNSSHSTRVNSPSLPSLDPLPASTPPRDVWTPDICTCGIDVCHCRVRHPGTPPTPSYIELWDPRINIRPVPGVHYQRDK